MGVGRYHDEEMKTILRIILDILLIIAVVNGWWLVAIILVLVGAWFFKLFIEVIIAGIAYDALFGMVSGMGWRGYVGTIIAIVLLLIIRFFKKLVR
jgi:hypothetical protein